MCQSNVFEAMPWPLMWPPYLARLAETFAVAPQQLQQAILPWTFAGIVVNETNSSNPAAEHAVVNQFSYGKQLGRIADVLAEIIDAKGGAQGPAQEAFMQMKQQVDAIKMETEATRFDAVLADLKRLRARDPESFAECLKRVAALGA